MVDAWDVLEPGAASPPPTEALVSVMQENTVVAARGHTPAPEHDSGSSRGSVSAETEHRGSIGLAQRVPSGVQIAGADVGPL